MCSQQFEKLVNLYRGLGRPAMTDSQFVFQGELRDNLIKLKELWDEHNPMLSDFEMSCNGSSVGTYFGDSFPTNIDNNKEITLKVSLPGGDFQFVDSLDVFLSFDNKLNMGLDVENVYLVQEDYIFGEKENNERIKNTLVLSRFINELSKLANYIDRIDDNGRLKIVFIDTGNSKKIPPIVIEPNISIENASYPTVDLTVFNNINNHENDNAHVQEKQSMFRVSLIEVLREVDREDDNFNNLIKQWELLKETYYGNFECYLTNFSFLKQKKEAAENYMSVSSKISSTLSSISGKLFGLPISIGVALAILKSSEKFESILTLIGVAITSLLILFTIQDQRKVLHSIRASIDALFSHTKSAKSGELSELIASHKKDLFSQIDKLNLVMVIFLILSITPFILSLLVYLLKFEPDIVIKFDTYILIFMKQLLS
ncbi:hypothetical protein [Leclercia sp.]|jgi:hypothetical protein|uniref:hypothetical protein n=1 Tax=Leclercia sp. TaxID=1898428 RepID=UPI00289F6F49|nr:hypothetical protein [Leclercia sp.]